MRSRMNIIKSILDYFRNIIDPYSCPLIFSKDLSNLILGELGFIMDNNDFKDNQYRLIPENKLIRFIRSLGPESKYEKEYNDCDDMAQRLRVEIKKWLPGACAGLADIKYIEDGKSKKHELVIAVTSKRDIIFIDAQTRAVMQINETKEYPEILEITI
jgi:hypothetical protein